MHQNLVEKLGRLQLSAQFSRHLLDDRLENVGQPVPSNGHLVDVDARHDRGGAVTVEVVQQPTGLVFLDIQPGEL